MKWINRVRKGIAVMAAGMCIVQSVLGIGGFHAAAVSASQIDEEKENLIKAVMGITLSETELTLKAGEEAVISLEYGEELFGGWKISDPGCVSIEANGTEVTVKARRPGTAVLTAQNKNYGTGDTCTITVTDGPYAFPMDELTMVSGESVQITMPAEVATRLNWYLAGGPVTITQNEWMPNVFTLTAGTVTEESSNRLFASFYDWVPYGTRVDSGTYRCGDAIIVTVLPIGITEKEIVMVPGAKETIATAGMMEGLQMQWSSADSSIAEVDESGTVTANKNGSTTITMTGFDRYGMYGTYTCELHVYEPTLSEEKAAAAIGSRIYLEIEGAGENPEVSWTSSDEKIAWYYDYDQSIIASAEGTATITAKVYGKELTCEITVTDPYLKESMALLETGKTKKLKVLGTSEDSKITYKSANKKVATVSRSGKITAKGDGSTQITVTVDGRELSCYVLVAKGKAVQAVKAAQAAIGSKYSTSKRMKDGYYDCSSLVWKCYKEAGVYIGSKTSAPTAAELARALVKEKKVVAYEMVSTDELKPGDLFFYGGSNNDRYMGIWHVAMYCGSYEGPAFSFFGFSFGGTAEYGIFIEASTSAGGVIRSDMLMEYADGVTLIARPVQ
ncbi:MAG: Ig-like domain-containing protein [Lachnospiraceae bacterium]|nr:Ig-like domain-containing protein [Lachnospiraceae bacterium]